jgi:hypothetical protein
VSSSSRVGLCKGGGEDGAMSSVGNLAVNRILYVSYSTAIFGVCNSVRLL